jgi:hypothetical protein
LIQHKIDLFAAGLEYNVATRVDLDSSRAAFQSHSSLDSLRPIEVRAVEVPRMEYQPATVVADGVYCLETQNSIRLFAAGSASLGVPYKEWEIPTPVPGDQFQRRYHICPSADVIAFVEILGPK